MGLTVAGNEAWLSGAVVPTRRPNFTLSCMTILAVVDWDGFKRMGRGTLIVSSSIVMLSKLTYCLNCKHG